MGDQIEFNEVNIQRLFGNEAAEDEDPKRLREYYFKGNVYNQVVTELPLRILVGHKGIGKSALFKVAIAEDREKGIVPILVQPNDIVDFPIATTNFLLAIQSWTDGLKAIILGKVFAYLGISNQYVPGVREFPGSIWEYIEQTFSRLGSSDYDPARQEILLNFMTSPKIAVYIDDLDRGWQGYKSDVTRISALMNAIRDLSNSNRNISFRIALRSDVYYLYRTSDESTDKIEGSVVWHTWTNHEIFVLLIKRIETYFGRSVNETELLASKQSQLAKFLRPIMEERFTGRGHWAHAPTYQVIMSLIRKRPRDLVKLCTLAARHAYVRRSGHIGTEDLESVFEEYSQGRIQDTINEYRSELPLIEHVLLNMRPNRKERTTKQGYVYSSEGLLSKIRNIAEQRTFNFSSGRQAEPKDLAAFLYKINFLTARKETEHGIVRKYFEENRYLSSHFADFGFDWEIHPAYRWALQPFDQHEIFETLRLSADDD